MRINKSWLILGIAFCFSLGRLSTWVVNALGPTDPPAPPGATSSYSLNDLYNRLNSGTAGTPRAFTEPSVSPGVSTTYSLNEIMAEAPQRQTAIWSRPIFAAALRSSE